jgi:phospholipid/cholesterol/gamma-HCH transport system substrate-binding protein
MKRTNDFLVGLSIIGGFVIVLAAILWVKQADLGGRRERVVARVRDVGHVRVGSPVLIRGVKAGQIEKIELAPQGWVELQTSLDRGTIIPEQPVMLLSEASLFGEWQATIISRSSVPRDADVEKQLSDANLGRGVLPGATLPDIAQLTAVAGRIAGDVAGVAERVQVAFDDRAARELRGSIRNFADLSNVLARTVKEQSNNLTAMSSNVNEGVASLVHSATLLRAIAERVVSSTAKGQVYKIVEDAAEASSQLRMASKNLLTISQQLGRSQDRLESFITAGDSVVTKINSGRGSLGLMVNDPSLYRNSDSLVVQLRSLIADLQKNPKKYVNVRIF